MDEMGGGADARRLDRRNATKTKIMQLEVDKAGLASPFQRCEKDSLHLPALRADTAPVPDLYEQRLQVISQPIAGGIGVFDRHQNVASGNDSSLRHGSNDDRQPTPMG